MNYIKGKIRKIIYENQNGYTVALFKVSETNDEFLKDLVKKVITITGVLLDSNMESEFILYGQYVNNERFGYQYSFTNYEKIKPTDESSLIEYFSSSLIKGCGEKTAKSIVEVLGKDAISLIKDNPNVLLTVKGMNPTRAAKIYESVMKNESVDDIIIKLKNIGFSVQESTKIYNKFRENTLYMAEENLYLFKEVIDFNKIDSLYIIEHDLYDDIRVKACIIEGMNRLSFQTGDIYYFDNEISLILKSNFKIELTEEKLEEYLFELTKEFKIIKSKEKYYLKEYYEMEESIANNLLSISTYQKYQKNYDIEAALDKLEDRLNIKYNDEQRSSIKGALNNPITIISGGPGTGKTTIVNAIVKLFIELNKLNPLDVYQMVALLAPTGRASRKLALSTGLPAQTIHRYLKWNKETNSFGINEYNKNYQKLIVVDETSMIDITLFDALLRGISSNITLVLVGDSFQLPSVGPGLILNDLIDSDMFSFHDLKTIYRQSSDSYIPYLAREIKNHEINEEILNKKDDYNFLNTNEDSIKNTVAKICKMSLEKGLKEDEIQVLAPIYKSQNGIDNLNVTLQEIYNPPNISKKEIKVGDVIFRVGDKVLQLTNNPETNVFNGDIGYIEDIKKELLPPKREVVIINFDGNRVSYKKDEMLNLKHAYAITIHKSQGSEFQHVIMPITRSYSKMLYNKLLYTGVSRAKKSLVIIGDPNSLKNAIYNDYSTNRKTTLKEKITYKFTSQSK